MAISKKQQAEFDAKLEAALTQAALRWTNPTEPDIRPPSASGELSKGFLVSGGWERPFVEVACSSGVYHAIGRNDKITSQGGRWLFSTRLLALRSARHRAEMEAASILRRIDKMIEAETNSSQR